MTLLSRIRLSAKFALRLIVPLVCGGIVVFVYVTAVLTSRGQHLEDRALSAATMPRNVPLLLRLVSVPDLLIALIVIVLIAVMRKRLDLAVLALTIIGTSNVATQVLKYGLLWRPDLAGMMTENTFPSGHTTAYVSVFLAAIVVVPPVIRSVLSVPAAILSSGTAIALLGFGWHRLSDIVGAIAVVTFIATLGAAVIPRWRSAHETPRRPLLESLCTQILAVVILIALVLSAIAFALALFTRHGADFFMLAGTETIATAAIFAAFLTFTVYFSRLTDGQGELLSANKKKLAASV